MALVNKLEDRRSGNSRIYLKRFMLKKCFQNLHGADFVKFAAAHPTWITAMDIDKNSRYLVSACNKRCLNIHDLSNDTGHPHHTKQLAEGVPRMTPSVALADAFKAIQWFPFDSGLFTTSGLACTVSIWDANRMKALERYRVSPSDTHLVNLSPQIHQHHMTRCPTESPLIAVASHRNEVPLIDVRLGSFCHRLTGHAAEVTAVRWSSVSNNMLASGDAAGVIKFWDVRSARSCIATLHPPCVAGDDMRKNAHDGRITGLEFTPDGLSLVSVGTDCAVKHWDVVAERLLPIRFANVPVTRHVPTALQISGWGNYNVLFVPTKTEVEVLDLTTGAVLTTLMGHIKKVTCISVDNNYKEMYSAGRDSKLLLWTFREIVEDMPRKHDLLSMPKTLNK